MPDGRTICAACANLVIPEGERKHWRAWLCFAVPRDDTNFVTGQPMPPYVEAWRVNGVGECRAFVAGPNVLNPKETVDGNAEA